MTEGVTEARLEGIVENADFDVVFQPIKTLKGQIIKTEVLVRFEGLNTQDTINDFEKRLELIQSLTREIIEKTLAYAEELRAEIPGSLPPFAVNLPAVLIPLWPDFAEELREQLEKHHLQEDVLEIEFTEHGILSVPRKKLVALCTELNKYGIHVMQDDYGDGTKDDGTKNNGQETDILRSTSFQGIKTSAGHLLRDDLPHLKAAIEHARKKRMCLIIEQVRDAEILRQVIEKLREYDFPQDKIGIQGYVFSKPLTAAQLNTEFRNKMPVNENLPIAA